MSVTVLPAFIKEYPEIFYIDDYAKALRLKDLAYDAYVYEYTQNMFKNLKMSGLDDHEILEKFPRNMYDPNTRTIRPIVSESFKSNGVEVTIRGDEPSVRSIINVLQTYPPKGPTYSTDEEIRYYDLSPPCKGDAKHTTGSSSKSNVPAVGILPLPGSTDHSIVIMGGTKFSGSGFVVVLADSKYNDPSDKYIPLFRDKLTGIYNAPGGRIDKTDPDKTDLNILYHNAIKETYEESAGVLTIVKDSNSDDFKRPHTDIDTIGDTKYRTYLFLQNVDMGSNPLASMKNKYDSNLLNIRTTPGYSAAYTETDDIKFFRVSDFVDTIKKIKASTNLFQNIPSYNFKDVSGSIVAVGGRTIKGVEKMI
jgi:hypothetical protein